MKYQQMTLATLQAIIERRVMKMEETTDVKLRTLAFVSPDESSDVEYVSGGHLIQDILCRLEIDGQNVDYSVQWDTVDDCIVSSRNENEAGQFGMERHVLMQFADGKASMEDVAEVFGLDQSPKFKQILNEYKKEWKAIATKGKSEEEIDDIKTDVTYYKGHQLLNELKRGLGN